MPLSPLSVLAIVGSLRQKSFNRAAMRLAVTIAAREGVHIEEADLKKLNLPLYDADVEASGIPEPVQEFKRLISHADLLLIASPEYNHSIPGVLKNAIDWASSKGNAFDGKTAVIFGASTGPFGTARMQHHLRQVLASLNVLVVPQPMVMIRLAQNAFTEDGMFIDPKMNQQLEKLIQKGIWLANAVRA